MSAANTSPRAATDSRAGSWVAALAVAIVALDCALAAAGAATQGFDLVALLIAPGLVLTALLPERVRREPLALAAVVPALGYAASSTALITASRLGLELTATSVRALLLVVIALCAIALPQAIAARRPAWHEALALAAPLVAAATLGALVVHGYPVPGNDWAKYLLYADEIRGQGSLLIDNPFWMLGVPFREDPGAPAVYGSFLILSGQQAAILAHGILVFALMAVASVFAYVRSFWGPLAGALAALAYAVVPMSQDILAWHGLANVAALALMPVVFMYASEFLTTGLDARRAAGLALVLVALAATHRLSFTLTLGTLAIVAVFGLAARGARPALREGLLVIGFAAAIGAGVIADLVARQKTFGGTQGYEAYLPSKVDLGLVALDLSVPFVAGAGLALAWALWNVRRQPALVPALGLLAVCAAGAYSWLLHFPLAYLRMAYYLPLALAPLIGVAALELAPRHRRIGAVAAAAMIAATAALAVGRAGDVRAFYSFADDAAVRGMRAVSAQLRPGEVVVTDRCWSFQSAWLLHTRVLPALAPEDIQPKAELARARVAQQILDGLPAGVAAARRLGVRFLLVDPACTDSAGRGIEPPLIGRPVYASRRLVVLAMPADPRS